MPLLIDCLLRTDSLTVVTRSARSAFMNMQRSKSRTSHVRPAQNMLMQYQWRGRLEKTEGALAKSTGSSSNCICSRDLQRACRNYVDELEPVVFL